MRYCVNCGHELGVGRYCTNCGHPVDAEAPAQPDVPPTQPAAGVPPSPARFPLFADEAEPGPAPTRPIAPMPTEPHTDHRRSGPAYGVWIAVGFVLVLIACLGGFLLLSGDGDSPDQASDPASSAPGSHQPTSSKSPETSAPSEPGDVTSTATIAVPDTAPPGQDTEGKPVTYDGDNMLDGVPETTWRMAGDGTGQEITITLPQETTLRSVGLINGYAKTAVGPQGGKVDWYHGNRRIESVEWVFDDGSTVSQDLGDTSDLQSTDVDVTTTTITLRLVAVSAPGKGPASRNYTAISDLSLISAG